ncbi:MAG TPA: hypothetical protein VGY54_18180 [Polyangiaceae bacterium]|jgi:hypothetical protein|nr:hypothetical protein [Polyangiaceae bacterium]
MKGLLLGIVGVSLATLLAGCPIYPDTGNYRVCTANGCFDCPNKTYSAACIPWQCGTSADCGDGLVCGPTNTCIAGSLFDASIPTGRCATPTDCPSGSVCGQDNACHAGDCGGGVGCPSGYVCTLDHGQAECETSPSARADAGSRSDGSVDASMDGSTDASMTVDATGTADALPGEGAATDAVATDSTPADAAALEASVAEGGPCNADSQCAGPGAKCINGQCVAQSQLCTDTTQCIASGESCVDGRCVPQCSSGAPCPAGYSCDFTHARGVCSINPNVCMGGGQCQGGAVCVEGHCVAPCVGGDADSPCPGSQVCANGGCIPNERASFACRNDGQSGQLANTCGAASICLHGDCYLACDADAGGCASGTVCKQVTVAHGTFAVCAAATNLGSDCDPAAGRYCDAGPCIDGYCR